MKKTCWKCKVNRPHLKRPKTNKLVCKCCFFELFESEIHKTIVNTKLFSGLTRICIGLSGGKDSIVIAHVLNKLNKQFKYGIKIHLLCIDEGLIGYRDCCMKAIHECSKKEELPLKIVSFKKTFGWTMDEIVKQVGKTNNCTFCGIFRRKALDMGAQELKVDGLVTGHNADDLAETILMNIFRGDIARLKRCLDIRTFQNEGTENVVRLKPFKYVYEKEIVLYAHFKKLKYFSTDCKYYMNSFRSQARDLIKDLERIRSRTIIDIICGAETMQFRESHSKKKQVLGKCVKCGYISSQKKCRACVYMDSLNSGVGLVGIYERGGKISDSRKKRLVNEKQKGKSLRDN